MQIKKWFLSLNLRQKIAASLLVGICGFFIIWGLATGRLHIGAETVGGNINGITYDDTGNVLAGVNISVQGNYTVSGSSINATSDSSGRYSLTGLKENAVISFSKDGTAFPETFDDVPNGYWAQKHIAALVKAGIVSGYTATKFDPEKIVTRDQMAVFIARSIAGGDAAVPAGPATAAFTDVPTSHWAFKYIEFLSQLGVVGGYSDKTYKPANEVTRDQMAVFLSRAAGLDPYDNPIATFTDVPKDHWAYKYIETCFLNGIVSGYSATEYRPNDKVTRAQMAVFLLRAFPNYPLTQNGYKVLRGVYSVKPAQTKTYDIFLSKQQSVCTDSVSVSGRVFDSIEKKPLRGVQVTVDRGSLPAPYNEKDRYYGSYTDSAGYFEFGCLPKSRAIILKLISEYLNEGTKSITTASTGGANSGTGVILLAENRTKATFTATVKDSAGSYIPESYLVLDRLGQKYSNKIATTGTVSLEVPPGTYEVLVQKILADKIIYYKIPIDKSFASLKAGTNTVWDLTGLAVDREETY